MKTLDEYLDGKFLIEGDPDLLEKIRPAFINLIDQLRNLDASATDGERFAAFEDAFEIINRYEDEIETVERESILEAIYDIGEIVGLDRQTEFAEEWRGDW